MERYNHQDIERKWQAKWAAERLYEVPDAIEGKDNYYQLVEFPYPSGNLHVGHWYAFCGPDIHARYMRMTGHNVLFPIGFDAFGLPAENAAIKRGLNPADWTEDNMAHMRAQIDSMGASFDRSREIATCRPDYYRHTQWLFNRLFAAGLVERKTTEANWCPSCKTVLANEQVTAGACERCGTVVEKREMPQWQVKITKYADRLIDDLDGLDWPAEIKQSQKNWIGRSEGALIKFQISNFKSPIDIQSSDEEEKDATSVEVFTTRPDTLYGATYMVLAPEHARVQTWKDQVNNWAEVEAYIAQAAKKSDIERQAEGKEKSGVKLDGIVAINPATGEEIPVYIADYVLAHYGTGAIMAVPAHDERDYAFARKYNLPIKYVVRFGMADVAQDFLKDELKDGFNGGAAYSDKGILQNSGQFDGMMSDEAGKAITEKVGGRMTRTYRLRDWGVSRQRYWGCPIPLVYCENCAKTATVTHDSELRIQDAVNPGWFAVPDDQLPVALPQVDNYLPNDDGRSPLAKNDDFVRTTCPHCGGPATRETDTMDTFVDSSWYFLRYCDPHNAAMFADKDKIAGWMPVDFYSGGAEHTTMHLLYSRFWHKALYDLGLVAQSEPYVIRRNRGLIMGPDGNKMSKSKGNVIDPDDIVRDLGADTLRLYLAFIGPYNEVGNYPWNPQSIVGVRRFVERVWRLKDKGERKKEKGESTSQEVDRVLHTALAAVTESIRSFKLNTGVAALMACLNDLEKQDAIGADSLRLLATMLAPYAPHIAEELWAVAGGGGSVHLQSWPSVDETLLATDTVTIAVQVGGKVRAEVVVPSGATQADVTAAAMADERVRKYVGEQTPRKIVFVPGRLINIVI